MAEQQKARPLHEIGEDILDHWKRPYFGARPYINAMLALDKITDHYGVESAKSIVQYFLANARTWSGEDARRVKAELRKLVG